MEHWSVEDYKNFTNKTVKKTKYRANKTSVDGHTFDSRKYGPAYLFEIGIPSAISAKNTIVINKRQTHRWYWTELRANQAAKDYFGRYYGVDWSQYENFVESNHYYPTDKPLPQFLRDDY